MTPTRRWGRASLVAGIVVAAGLGACSSAQEIVLSIDTTAGIPCDIDHIRVRATSSGTATYERDIADVRLPVTLRLADETTRGAFMLEVTGLKGTTEVLRAFGPLQFGNAGDLAAHVVLESTCTVDSPCELPMLTGAGSTPPPVAKSDCGVNVRRYTTSPAIETYRDACSVPGMNVGSVLMNARGAALITLSDAALSGFRFRFYGRPIRQIWAHEDGYISFSRANPDAGNDLDPGGFDRDILGSGVPPPPQSAMIFWDQLTLNSTGVCYALEGSPGTQKLRITWARVCQTDTCTTDSLNFTVVLDERDGRVSFTYGDMIASNASRGQGSTATVGLVNEANGCAATDCNSMTGLCKDNRTPCGYSQVFSNMPQTPRVANVQFDPFVETQ
jgi:hypothetical protein